MRFPHHAALGPCGHARSCATGKFLSCDDFVLHIPLLNYAGHIQRLQDAHDDSRLNSRVNIFIHPTESIRRQFRSLLLVVIQLHTAAVYFPGLRLNITSR